MAGVRWRSLAPKEAECRLCKRAAAVVLGLGSVYFLGMTAACPRGPESMSSSGASIYESLTHNQVGVGPLECRSFEK